MKLYGESVSTGRAPKERCERWMSEAMSGKSHSAEVVKANVHKEGTKQRQFLPSPSIWCGANGPTSDIAEKQEVQWTWCASLVSCSRGWGSTWRSLAQTVAYHLQDKVPEKQLASVPSLSWDLLPQLLCMQRCHFVLLRRLSSNPLYWNPEGGRMDCWGICPGAVQKPLWDLGEAQWRAKAEGWVLKVWYYTGGCSCKVPSSAC